VKFSFIIPTKDRPQHIGACLQSLTTEGNSQFIDMIFVVACGTRLDKVIEQYIDVLPIRYIHTTQCGQIYQRNLGIQACPRTTEFVGFLDDDVVVCPSAFQEMSKFLESKSAEGITIGGACMNVINAPSYLETKYLWPKRILLQLGPRPGSVTIAGQNTTVTNVDRNWRTEWLPGGITIWSWNIISANPQKPINTRYAALEDVIFSYPLHWKNKFFVCASARCKLDQQSDIRSNIAYISFKQTVARLYLCETNQDLSVISSICFTLLFQILQIGRFDRPTMLSLGGVLRGILFFLRMKEQGRMILEDQSG
jgi:glycosyltransferase involved in cell wall biosynthesis